MVEYLQRAGIDRSKKQVASHIQVLRNMWKGEPGQYLFHLFKINPNYYPRISLSSWRRGTIP